LLTWLGFPCGVYRADFRFLVALTVWPVFFKLPAFPVALTVTSNSNSPPMSSLHFTQTSVSGMIFSRAAGIVASQILQNLSSGCIVPLLNNEGLF
jgi:hypothetical protein